MCKFFLVQGNEQALLGMPDTDTLNIIHIHCNTIDTQKLTELITAIQPQPSMRAQGMNNTTQT